MARKTKRIEVYPGHFRDVLSVPWNRRLRNGDCAVFRFPRFGYNQERIQRGDNWCGRRMDEIRERGVDVWLLEAAPRAQA